MPKVADEVPLSIHGMAYVCPAVPAVQRLVDAFLAALKTAIVMQRGINPRPTEPVRLKVPGDDFTRTVNMATDTELSSDQLFALLGGEPATWLGIGQQNGQWTWDLTDARLSPYAEVTTVDDYLVRLDALVALPQQPAVADSLPALALPEAFDHLDLAWRIATGKHLFRVPRTAVPAKLTQPAASAEEFESRCSALADMLKAFDFPAEGGSLNNMKAALGDLLGQETAGRAMPPWTPSGGSSSCGQASSTTAPINERNRQELPSALRNSVASGQAHGITCAQPSYKRSQQSEKKSVR